MPLGDRWWYRGESNVKTCPGCGHWIGVCTCREKPVYAICPKCGEKSLFIVRGASICLNLKCKSKKRPFFLFAKRSSPIKSSGKKNVTKSVLSWNRLKDFLWEDKTDEMRYIAGHFVCEDFARELQKNAESIGYRCALVYIGFVGKDDGHMCNAFETSDKGIIYIDCTGDEHGNNNNDKTVIVEKGIQYHPQFIFGDKRASSMGIINHVDVIW